MKFYVATSLGNADQAERVRDLLVQLGHAITFDWMDAPGLHDNDPRVDDSQPQPPVSVDDWPHRAGCDLQGVITADAVIVIMPGGVGTHTELGAALAMRQKSEDAGVYHVGPEIFLWASGGLLSRVPHDSYPCVFWYHPLITTVDGDIADLVATVEAWSKTR